MANDAYTGFRVRLSVFNPQTLLIGQIIYLQEASLSPSLNGENAMLSAVNTDLRNVVFTIIIEER